MHHKTMFYFHTWIHMDGEQGSDIMHISFVDIISYQGICENIICRAYIWSATVVAGRCAKVSFPVRGPARRLQRLFVITWPTMPFIRGTIWKCCRYHLSCSIEHWLSCQGICEGIICHACTLVCDGRRWEACRDIISCQGTYEKAAEIIRHNLTCNAFH